MVLKAQFPFTIPYHRLVGPILLGRYVGNWVLFIKNEQLVIKRDNTDVRLKVTVFFRCYTLNEFKGVSRCYISFGVGQKTGYVPIADLQIFHPSEPGKRHPSLNDVFKGRIDVLDLGSPTPIKNPFSDVNISNGGSSSTEFGSQSTKKIPLLHRPYVHPTPLSDLLLRLLNSPDFADAALKCGDAVFPVHKCILSLRSPVFAAMFKNQMKESLSGIVDIVNIKPDVLQATLKYVYTNNTDHVTDLLAEDLLSAADKYQLEDLKLICINKLRESINVDNVFRILVLGDLYDDGLKLHAIERLKGLRFSEIYKIGGWKSLKTTHPDLLMDVLFFILMDIQRDFLG